MRFWMRHTGFVVAVMMATGGLCSAQSLASVAREEQERRKTIESSGKVYTNEDLRGASVVSATGAQAATVGEPEVSVPELDPTAAAPEASPGSGVEPSATESDWRDRMMGAREELERLQLFLEALQSRVNGLWADFTARDDPQQRAALEGERQRALAEMDRVRRDVEEKQGEIAAIEEEARRANVPPGWLR